MAKATKRPVDNYTVTLELSQKEAEVLRQLVGNVTGKGRNDPRSATDSIWEALCNAGVEYVEYGLSAEIRAS